MRPYAIICDDKHPDWHTERHCRLTGSAVGTLMGALPPYARFGVPDDAVAAKVAARREELRQEKLYMLENQITPGKAMLWGSACERVNMRTVLGRAGIPHRPLNLFLASVAVPRLGATIDGVCRATGRVRDAVTDLSSHKTSVRDGMRLLVALKGSTGLVEMKQADWRPHDKDYNKWLRDLWTRRVPEYYWWQCQVQMMVTGYPFTLCVCRIGASDFRWHVVMADEFEHRRIRLAVEEFYGD